jgi:NADH-quinone oxidoreductase subunit G
MAVILVDGKEITVSMQDNLLHACLAHGFDLPYFCWHPALGSVGACRQCAVKQFANADDKTGKIVMACMTPATDGTCISIADAEAAGFRASVIEWMMTNHPHDCPVCEEGGECHLQDMTVMTGHNYRRYRFTKRTHRNQYLGPFVKHEMNRCIACYRCVRFYRDYAGGHDLDVQGAHNDVYFGRDEDGVLESEFSGNLVEVCPTGVFTDKTLSAAYVRKWDMRSVPSVCVHCGVGCNTNVSEHHGQVRRILNRFNGAVNGYFLCDRGRFGYGFANAADRPREGFATKTAVLEKLAQLFTAERKVIGIGSPRATLEANFALRSLVGPDAFYAGVSAQEAKCLDVITEALTVVKTPTLREVETADAVLVLGEDVSNTAPRLALSLRQAVRVGSAEIAARLRLAPWQDAAVREAAQEQRSPLFIATPMATRLDDVAAETYRAAPGDIARLGFAVLHQMDPQAPAVEGLDAQTRALAVRIADALTAAAHPLVVCGCGLGEDAVLRAGFGLARALGRNEGALGIALAVPECNSLGLALMQGGSLREAFAAARDAVVIVLENDLYRRADTTAVEALFERATVITLDHVTTQTTTRADIVLPCANFAAAEGTLVSAEGRAQRMFQAVFPGGDIQPAWRWLGDIAKTCGRGEGWNEFDDVGQALRAALPVFSGIGGAAPGSEFRVAGSRIRTEPHRFSGRTALEAGHDMHEPKPPEMKGTPFSATMEGYYGPMPAALIPFFWAPGWNSGQSLHKFQDETGGLRGGEPGVRLLEPRARGESLPLGSVPAAFVREAGRWLVVPHALVFGGEELSALAPAVAERMEPAAFFLNEEDARSLGVAAGDYVDAAFEDGSCQLPARLAPELVSGVAACSLGLAGWAVLRKVQSA